MWYIYTMENYSDIKQSEVPIYATIWTCLTNIMLSEKNPVTNMILFTRNVQNRRNPQREKVYWLYLRVGGVTTNEYERSFGG